MPAAALAPGFDAPARDAQRVFRAVMDALAHPTIRKPLATSLRPPAPLTPELAAIALALADHEAPLWLDEPLAGEPSVAAFLRFHTGATISAEPDGAAFALVAAPAQMPPFLRFALGSEDYPDRSTTLVLAVESLDGGEPLRLAGPGLRRPDSLAPHPAPANLGEQLARNRELFPRGIDLIFAARGSIAAVPRSARPIMEA